MGPELQRGMLTDGSWAYEDIFVTKAEPGELGLIRWSIDDH